MADKESAKKEILKLIEKYDKVISEKRFSKYTEEETKKDFILPLFRALGWYTEDSGEVRAEENISKKRVDYSFRINGIPKFFLEAKSLKEDLNNPKFVEQAINYSWHKGCTWAVLTDFESVRIFNAEWKTTNPMHSQLKEIKCKEFVDNLDDLWLLSRESFEKGLIDKVAEKWGKKTKKTSVDKQLLEDFTRFRESLSKNITKLNQVKNITEEDLDESIQRILDRLIFIRNCEDRGLEEKRLWEAKNETNILKKIRDVFQYFNQQYDSKIFANHLCDDLVVDNDVLKEIIEGLYQTKDRSVSYDFSAIEADVLGNIYEQYLGHILQKGEKRAKLTENHAHRKEQGIYYTPTYIVDYIVRNTLGEMLRDKKVNPEKIKILDPACGSGSFLIKTFDILNEYYSKHDKNYNQKTLGDEGSTYSTKERILKNNIFGVDLDKQAVEIAQLNLLLKIAERSQKLPLLQKNIKNGNSLIDDNRLAGEKAFVWKNEFEEILNGGGFDVIIGNPPYLQKNAFTSEEKEFILDKYQDMSSNINLVTLFMKKSLDLLKDNGFHSFIVPKSLTFSKAWDVNRKLLLPHLITIVDCSKAWKEVLLEQVIYVVRKNSNSKTYESYFFRDNKIIKLAKINKNLAEELGILVSNVNQEEVDLLEKIKENCIKLSDVTKTFCGLPYQSLVNKNGKYPVIGGKEIGAYTLKGYKGFFSEDSFDKFKEKTKIYLQPKIVTQDIVAHITKPKDHIKLMSYLDIDNLIPVNTINCTVSKNDEYPLKLILAILNSEFISWYSYRFIFNKAIRTMHFYEHFIGKIIIPTAIDGDVKNQLIKYADQMLLVNKRLNEIGDKKNDARFKLEEEIKKTSKEIDELVYKIYGIEPEERKIIENSLS